MRIVNPSSHLHSCISPRLPAFSFAMVLRLCLSMLSASLAIILVYGMLHIHRTIFAPWLSTTWLLPLFQTSHCFLALSPCFLGPFVAFFDTGVWKVRVDAEAIASKVSPSGGQHAILSTQSGYSVYCVLCVESPCDTYCSWFVAFRPSQRRSGCSERHSALLRMRERAERKTLEGEIQMASDNGWETRPSR